MTLEQSVQCGLTGRLRPSLASLRSLYLWLILWERIEGFTLGVGLHYAFREDVSAGCLWEGLLSPAIRPFITRLPCAVGSNHCSGLAGAISIHPRRKPDIACIWNFLESTMAPVEAIQPTA